MIDVSITQRVRAGIALLDAYGPKHWRKKLAAALKAERFDLADGEHCVLGEVYGDFSDATQKLGIEGAAAAYGFDCSDDIDLYGNEYGDLEAEWRRQYAMGRSAAKKALTVKSEA